MDKDDRYLITEDVGRQQGLIPEQLKFIELESAQKVFRSGKSKKDMLSLALIAKERDPADSHVYSVRAEDGQKPRRTAVRSEFSVAKPFVRVEDVELVALWDRPRDKVYNHKNKIETSAVSYQGKFVPGQGLSFGCHSDQYRLAVDFSKVPRQSCQYSIGSSPMGWLRAVWDGEFQLRRIGKWVDLCVGTQHWRNSEPVIMYRVPYAAIASGDIEINADFDMPGHHGVVEFGHACVGDELATAHKPTLIYQALRENRRFVMRKFTASHVLGTHQLEYFRLLNGMVDTQLRSALEIGGSRQPLQNPQSWAFNPMLQFSAENLRRLAHHRHLLNSPYLKTALLESLGPLGTLRGQDRFKLKVKAEHTGRLQQIGIPSNSSHLYRLEYSDGYEQFVPASSLLYRYRDGTEFEINAGDRLTKGEVIGDFVPRCDYTWDLLLKIPELDGCIRSIASSLLAELAVEPGTEQWDGPGHLLDSRYVSSVTDLAKSRDNVPECYLDLRSSVQHMNGTTVQFPPMHFDGWEDMLLTTFNGVQVFLGSPRERRAKIRREQEKNVERKQRQKRSDSVTV